MENNNRFVLQVLLKEENIFALTKYFENMFIIYIFFQTLKLKKKIKFEVKIYFFILKFRFMWVYFHYITKLSVLKHPNKQLQKKLLIASLNDLV